MSPSNDTLFIDVAKAVFRPGEALQGELLWDLAQPPEVITLQLGWRTEGRGTTDETLVFSHEWPTASTVGKEAFSFQLPQKPFSFSGRLITVRWSLEAIVKKGKAGASFPFTLSPTGAEIDISQNSYDEFAGRKKSFSFKPH